MRFATISLFFLSSLAVFAQTAERCGTVAYENQRRKLNPQVETKAVFEQWLASKIGYLKQTSGTQRTGEVVYTIPVAVHIIHNGEPVGTGLNLSDARINSQIRTLNEDFRRLNPDRIRTRTEFLPAAADCAIEFKLAVTDPDGLPTNGITRRKGSQISYSTSSDDSKLKSQDYWDASRYLNLWVCDISGAIVGYAQFPQSTLPGLEDYTTSSALTDGVVIDYLAFGESNSGVYNKGRTTTHEIGHFLGLRHTWGDDGNCSTTTDYCNDTPKMTNSSSRCDLVKNACDNAGKAMVENYLDYSHDSCMNIFTQDQKLRMRTVLENSVRRKSLLTSPGLTPEPLVANNAGIRTITVPQDGQNVCQSGFSPRAVLRNYGSNTLVSATVSYQADQQAVKTFSWTGNLASGGTDTLSFPAVSLAAGNHTFSVSTSQPNGQTDSQTQNDTFISGFTVTPTLPLPFLLNFNDNIFPLSGGQIINADGLTTWKDTLAGGSLEKGNRAAYMDFYDYDRTGEEDVFITAPYDFSSAKEATLIFKVSHARYKSENSNDGLRVLVLTDCGNDWQKGTAVYAKFGADLETAPAIDSIWRPIYLSHWRNEIVDLSPFLGQKNVSFAFVGVNNFGNSLYVDDVQVALITGTESPVAEPVIHIFPNPSDGNFSIDSRVNLLETVIVDNLGREVFRQKMSGEGLQEIRCGFLAKGMYTVRLLGKHFSSMQKIIIAP
jgi:hypothetical protein